MNTSPADRYARQVLHWGEAMQHRIMQSTLLIAGVGGLGATVAQLMARGGVGKLYLVDDGELDWPDLNRQTLYGEQDIGRKKVQVAAERLAAINSTIQIIPLDSRINRQREWPSDLTAVADCLDNWPSRFALYNTTSAGCWFVHGGLQGDQGQILTLKTGTSQPLDEIFTGCTQPQGSIPVTPDAAAILAGMMAGELFQALGGTPRLLDRILVVGLEDFHCSILNV